MKKMIFLILFLFFVIVPSYAINFGTYKTETEYGLIDGFKWNFFSKDKPFVQLKSETEEEKIRLEKEKDKPQAKVDEVQMYRFMLDDMVVF